MIDVRIRYNGARVRLRGFGIRKLQNLRLLMVGIASIKARLARGIGSDDQKTKPLTKSYAKFKSRTTGRRAIRDMELTGDLLKGIKPRYADDNQAIGDASGRKGRIKARIYRELLIFSPQDQAAMSETAADLFYEQTAQVFTQLSPKTKRGSFRRQPVGGQFGKTSAPFEKTLIG